MRIYVSIPIKGKSEEQQRALAAGIVQKIYPKDSLLDYLQEARSSLEGYFVNSDYNIFDRS